MHNERSGHRTPRHRRIWPRHQSKWRSPQWPSCSRSRTTSCVQATSMGQTGRSRNGCRPRIGSGTIWPSPTPFRRSAPSAATPSPGQRALPPSRVCMLMRIASEEPYGHVSALDTLHLPGRTEMLPMPDRSERATAHMGDGGYLSPPCFRPSARRRQGSADLPALDELPTAIRRTSFAARTCKAASSTSLDPKISGLRTRSKPTTSPQSSVTARCCRGR